MNKSKLMLLALASTALAASPAAATADHAGYVGIEAGLLFPNDSNVSFDSNYNYDFVYDYDFDVGYKMGFDGDIIGGYDFGQFRAELELGYKTASVDDIGSDFLDQFVGINTDGDVSVWSLMVNGLWNPSIGDRWNAYIGGGIGWAWTKFNTDFSQDIQGPEPFDVGNLKDDGFAWQIIAGVGYNISDNIELGLKYRYFETKFKDSFEDNFDGLIEFDADGKVSSHSILASLIFSFGSAPPPPPATQTCPDGSVILATDACPPPPPPPPPPPEPERG